MRKRQLNSAQRPNVVSSAAIPANSNPLNSSLKDRMKAVVAKRKAHLMPIQGSSHHFSLMQDLTLHDRMMRGLHIPFMNQQSFPLNIPRVETTTTFQPPEEIKTKTISTRTTKRQPPGKPGRKKKDTAIDSVYDPAKVYIRVCFSGHTSSTLFRRKDPDRRMLFRQSSNKWGQLHSRSNTFW